MRQPGKKREPKTPLQAVFLKRLLQEMERAGLVKEDGSPNASALAKRNGAPPQTTISDLLRGADPRLETVFQLSLALEVSAVSLLTESTTNTGTILKLPSYPKISGNRDNPQTHKVRDRKRSRG